MLDLRMLRQELLHRRLLHLPLLLPVDLISNQNEREFLRLLRSTLVEELSDPRLDVIEGLHQKTALRACW